MSDDERLLIEAQREVDAMLPHTPPIAPPRRQGMTDAERNAWPPWCYFDELSQTYHDRRTGTSTPREVFELRHPWSASPATGERGTRP